jgi:hypothetical protein
MPVLEGMFFTASSYRAYGGRTFFRILCVVPQKAPLNSCARSIGA